jgi:hypothetical protein
MKYHLDGNSLPTEDDDPRLSKAIHDGLFSVRETRSAEKVARDYLKEVISFTLGHLKDRIGDALLSLTAVEWWLARPAVWSPEPMSRLQKVVTRAAKKAEFYRPNDKFHFITEADAAAFALVKEAAAYEDINVCESLKHT